MKFPQIQIRTTDMKIALNIDDPVQIIRQPKVSQHIEQPAAILEIKTTYPKLTIDSSQARRDLGLIGPLEATENYAKKGRQAALKGIARRAREGRQMMENSGKGMGRQIIQNIAIQNHAPKPPSYNIKFVPSVGSVKIDFIPGETDIKVTPQKPKIDVQINKTIHEYTPGKVTTEVVEYPSIEIGVIYR